MITVNKGPLIKKIDLFLFLFLIIWKMVKKIIVIIPHDTEHIFA